MSTYFALPDVGEGLTEADIVSWKVTTGDTVSVNQVLVEIETAKSLVELPSPHSGKVENLLIDEGATVEVGTPIIEFTGIRTDVGQKADHAETGVKPDHRTIDSDATSGVTLVGYGAASNSGKARRRRRKDKVSTPRTETTDGAVAEGAAPTVETAALGNQREAHLPALAKPPVRRLAKDWGVEINDVVATGYNGVVTRDDLVAYISSKRKESGDGQESSGSEAFAAKPAAADEQRIPIRGVRKATAKAMVDSAFTAPHVTEFLDVDVTRTMEFVRYVKQAETFGTGTKVSPLAIAASAVCWAVSRTPEINASVDGDEIVIKNYVNLGIAAATDRGLIVPNIKNAQTLGVADLAIRIRDLAETARTGKTMPEAQMNGTITITNVGVFGIDSGTPIINRGEGAIVALGQIRKRPWVVDDSIEIREVMTVSVSADHRIVDGAVISAFLSDIGSALQEPMMMLS